MLALGPADASAEPLCTDTWTGPGEGEWQTAGNWSTGKVPSSSDVACIGSGTTVTLSGGSGQASVLVDKGTLVISGGSLELSNALELSSVNGLRMSGGKLKGAATLDVANSLSWTKEGTMSGSGSTVIKPGASASIELSSGFELARLTKRSLVNEGTLTLARGEIFMSEKGWVKNTGTFDVTSEATSALFGESPSVFLNTGTFRRSAGSTEVGVSVNFENHGAVYVEAGSLSLTKSTSSNSASSWVAAEGKSINLSGGSFSQTGGSLAGSIKISGSAVVTVEGVSSEGAQVSLGSGTLSVGAGSMTFESLTQGEGTLTGAGTLHVSGSFSWTEESTMSGSGATVLDAGASGSIDPTTGFGWARLTKRSLVNEGTLAFTHGKMIVTEGAQITNTGTFTANTEPTAFWAEAGKGSRFVNDGTFKKTAGEGETEVYMPFKNLGIIEEESGVLKFPFGEFVESETQYGEEENPSAPQQLRSECGDGVDCATGNFSQSQADLAIGGRGVGLDLTRYYNSQAAVAATEHGIFGYGWTSSFSNHLVVEKTNKKATLFQAEGSTVPFTEGGGESFTAPTWSQDTLSGSAEAGYTLTLANQTKYKFSGGNGRLESVTDRNGNATTLSYTEAGRLEAITDPAGRKIKLAYNSEGLVESAKDPMGHIVKYTYESGQLASVTEPSEEKARWKFKYGSSHQLTTITDGRGGATTMEYNSSHQTISQKDPAERTTTFEYKPFYTKTTNKATGAVTVERFDSNDVPFLITHGYGTASATTEKFSYNAAGCQLSVTDGNGHTTTYTYDSSNNRTSKLDAEGYETKWEYNSTHDVISMTTPNGEKTTIKRESHGNPEVIERPAPGEKTQVTKYKYGSHGEVESMTDPLEHMWKYEYDSYGDRTAEIDPESNKRTWEYNEDSQETATVSPRGNAKAGEEEKYRTKTERDAQGRPLKVTDPLGHVTEYKYDGDGNVEKTTDANGHTTGYTYDADNEQTKVEAPNKDVTELEYDGAGQVIAEIDGDKHTTKYVRNVLEEVAEATDPLGHKTLKEYDAAGNLVKLTDPAKRTTTYKYDRDNRLTEISYSSGKPSTVKYEYDKDGNRTKIIDGTGTTNDTYDQLDRLTESENGHKETVKYAYDLANDQIKIIYPGGKEVTRAFDQDRRLEKVTDWLEHTTKFSYNPDSDLEATIFPSETKNEDKYYYNDADQMTEVDMLKSTETLASLAYTLDNDNQVKKTTAKGLPGEEVTEATYDEDNRVTKYGSTEYKYDAANNPTQEASSENTYNEGDELEKGTGVTYSYDELGERTKTKPSTGPVTSYGYDQAGELTSVERPKEGETAEIKDSYEYNGEGLRTAQTINGTTTYLVWNVAEKLPLILGDGTDSYIYGPDGYPIEQINSKNEPLYLHHDQQGSTRLITSSTGTIEGKCTYGAYGTPTCEGTATTPLGYDGQYTNSDTGLIYLRARYYDPATAQFLTVDPALSKTHEPYVYVGDKPLTSIDPSGECATARTAALNSTAEECKKLLGSIEGLARELLKRLRQMKENKRRLPSAEVKKYINTFEQKQQGLRKKLKKWNFKNCSEEIGETIPREIWELPEIKVREIIIIGPAA
ncbi:MAG TPA: RHS repeat-associated core domain-containing protein [Solirubrobacteraceae bacterium]|jgi:RHS repeat-associated protein|nr:RHS repeat-associated core domain-containing protein [Solirubrobacteraceae bacterium]